MQGTIIRVDDIGEIILISEIDELGYAFATDEARNVYTAQYVQGWDFDIKKPVNVTPFEGLLTDTVYKARNRYYTILYWHKFRNLKTGDIIYRKKGDVFEKITVVKRTPKKIHLSDDIIYALDKIENQIKYHCLFDNQKNRELYEISLKNKMDKDRANQLYKNEIIECMKNTTLSDEHLKEIARIISIK